MSNSRTLFKLFSLVGLLFFVAITCRLFYLQIVQHDFYDKFVHTQSKVNVVFTKDRGLILDKNLKPLAQNHKVASLYTFGKNIENPDVFVKALKSGGIAVKKDMAKTLSSKDSFVWIARHVSLEKAKELKEKVPGLEYLLEDARFYPEGNMLAGLIGRTGVDNQGLSGIEYYKDKELKGKTIPVNVMKDSRGKLILFDDSVLKTEPDTSIVLTVDSELQAVAESILNGDLENFQATRAMVLAIDVNSGDVVLAAQAAKGGKLDKSYATSYLFEPGSIFKAVSFSYLIENGLFRPEEKVNTSKPVILYGHSIKDVYTYKELTQTEVFTKSSNIGTVTLMMDVPKSDFHKFMVKSGFGQKTGIEGVSEESGVLRDVKKWSGLSLASLSIGQEIMVTPMQVARYYAAVANGGFLVQPRVIDYIITDNKKIYTSNAQERIFSEKTSSMLLEMLSSTVNTGTGKRALSNIVTIGGKTGTGQMLDKATGTYSKTDYVASFAGIFPVENPKIAMVVIYESPRSSIYGGQTGAQTFKKIAEQIAFSYDLGNERTKVMYAGK